jgi:hypothetical protein
MGWNVAKFKELFQEHLDGIPKLNNPHETAAKDDILRKLHVLLGDDFFERVPHTAVGILAEIGTDEEISYMPLEGFIHRLFFERYAKSSWKCKIRPYVEMILEERFAWTKEEMAKLKDSELNLALQHALEYDDPTRPSIWNITK